MTPLIVFVVLVPVLACFFALAWRAKRETQLAHEIHEFCSKQEATPLMLAEALNVNVFWLYPILRDMERQELLAVRQDHSVSHRRGGRPAFYYRSTLWEKTTTS